MKLQDHIDSTALGMTEIQVKAFFLGALCAEKPMPFHLALNEVLAEEPDSKSVLEAPLKETWDYLQKNLKAELEKMFPDESDIHTYMEIAKEQLDYFLTAMSLAGTNVDNCDDNELRELLDELEDTVEDMDDFLADSSATAQDGEDFKEFLIGTWADFTASK